ncbi:MAG: glycosyltransferase family 1 protein [Methylomonas sp.]|jgi:glycosyltransferase involved in cell wall biosynthesis
MFTHSENSTPTVFINGRFLSQRITGIQRYAREILSEMDRLLAAQPDSSFKLKVLIPKGVSPPVFKIIEVETCGNFQGHLWEQIDLPLRVGRSLLFSLCPTGPVLKKHQIITIHDLAVFRIPEAYSPIFRIWYKLNYSVIARRAPLTMTVSQFSAGEINRRLGVPLQKLRIALEGWQHLNRIDPDTAILEKFRLNQAPFVLAVSSPTPNKNFKAIVEAMEILGDSAPLCVAAGKADANVFGENSATLENIRPLGYVTDEELKALYRNAACFVFPSFYEGFGIPPLEAMSQGCPILAADIPAVKEVCGENALYFDPRQPRQLANCLQEIMSNPNLRQELSVKGIARAAQFTWEQGARINLEIIGQTLPTL